MFLQEATRFLSKFFLPFHKIKKKGTNIKLYLLLSSEGGQNRYPPSEEEKLIRQKSSKKKWKWNGEPILFKGKLGGFPDCPCYVIL